jgi:tetratricopeptide (TPR) repeat protein
MAGSCAYDAFSPDGCQLSIEDVQELPLTAVLGVASAFLLIGGLRLASGRSHIRHEARKAFALIKPAENLSPEDFGFQVLRPGETADTHKRPLHAASYVRRAAVEEGTSEASYTERELVEALRADKGIVLLGQPLDGKSRTLYEILSEMNGYLVVKPFLSKGLPGDDALELVDGKNVILLLEDLHEYVGRQIDLPELRRMLSDRTSSCIVASTCRDGPELRLVEEKLGRFYEEVDLKLKLTQPTAEEKGWLARSIGEEWDPGKVDDHPTLGSIAMERPLEAMVLRFRNLLRERPDYADTLRALKLLTAASVGPLTHRRVEAVLGRVFGRTDLHLRDCLRALAGQSFLRDDGSVDATVRPEPAYLRDAVTYTEGKAPRDDFFPTLVDALQEQGDAEALNGLGVACMLGGGWSWQAIWECFDRATEADPNYPSAWLNKTALLSAGGYHEEAVVAAERAVELKPEAYSYWLQKGRALHGAERHEEARDAYRRAAELEPDRPDVWRGLGSVCMDLDSPRDALSAFNRSIDLGIDYGYAEGWILRARALSWLGRDYQALRAYDRVTTMAPAIAPDNFEAWFNKAGLLRKLTRWQEALEAAEEAEHLRPDHPEVHNGRGEALFKMAEQNGDPDRLQEAHQAYTRATSLDEENRTAWLMKGVTLLLLERYEESSEAIDQSIALEPDRVENWLHKAQALLKMVEGQPVPPVPPEYEEALWWLCRAWRSRDQLPDGGASTLLIFQQIGYDPRRCAHDFLFAPGAVVLPQ